MTQNFWKVHFEVDQIITPTTGIFSEPKVQGIKTSTKIHLGTMIQSMAFPFRAMFPLGLAKLPTSFVEGQTFFQKSVKTDTVSFLYFSTFFGLPP